VCSTTSPSPSAPRTTCTPSGPACRPPAGRSATSPSTSGRSRSTSRTRTTSRWKCATGPAISTRSRCSSTGTRSRRPARSRSADDFTTGGGGMTVRVDVTNGVEGKDHLLSRLRQEYRDLLEIASGLDDKEWAATSPCEEWEVRDVVGHMVDVAESYLGYFTLAEKGWDVGAPLGWGAYPKALSACAQAYRRLPRLELLARLEGLSEPLLAKFEALDAEQWGTMLLPHRYGGPLPPFVLGVFQLI